MTVRRLPLRAPLLRPAPDAAAWERALAAIEHDLAQPIAVRDAADLRSTVHWSERLEPFEHQLRNLLTFCRRAPVTLIADEVGLGKTISAGLILSELMTRGYVTRALVLAPKILNPQWKEELEQKLAIRAGYAGGGELEALLASDVPVVITTYASARTRMEQLAAGGFDMLICDEAHKLRNLFGTRNTPQFAQAIHGALEARAFRYVVMLTATPIQNRLWDLYSLIDCLTVAKGHDNPLGTPSAFTSRFVADGKQSARQVVEGRRPELQSILGDYMVRTRRADVALEFPERTVLTHAAAAEDAELELVGLVGQMVSRRDLLAGISLAQAAMSSPQALRRQLQGMVARATATQEEFDAVAAVCDRIAVSGKTARLLALVEELREERPDDWRCIVFTTRRATQEAIGAALAEAGVAVGYISGDSAEANQEAIAALKAAPPRVNVIVSTDAGAEGVNLQAANVLVNYDLPWNPMVVEQRIGRVQRLASAHATVVVVNLVTAGTVEEQVVARLVEKLQLIANTVGDIEGVLESSELGDEDGFEEQIRDLVLRSLQGQDVEEALARIQANVAAAKQIWDDERVLVEETMGALGAMHDAGPAMPHLPVIVPRLPRSAFAPDPDRTLSAAAKERWHAVRATNADADEAEAEARVRAWVAEAIPGAGIDVLSVELEPAFHGRLWLRAAASVAHDRYETLLERAVPDAGHGDVAAAPATSLARELSPQELHGRLEESAYAMVADDPGVAAFCGFYTARLKEEQARAGASERLQDKVREHFTPSLAAEVVAAEGVRYEVARVRCRASYDGADPVEFESCVVPLTGVLAELPALTTCTVTGRKGLADAFVEDALTGAPILRSHAAQSDKSERWTAPDAIVICTWSGARLLPDEAGVCSLSELPFDAELLDARGRFTRLVKILERPRPDQAANHDFLTKLYTLHHPELAGFKRGWFDQSPLGNTAVVHLQTAGLFGWGKKDLGVVVGLEGGAAVLGRVVVGRTRGEAWSPA
jgi:superfamily II DNA or RNA helicase